MTNEGVGTIRGEHTSIRERSLRLPVMHLATQSAFVRNVPGLPAAASLPSVLVGALLGILARMHGLSLFFFAGFTQVVMS